MARGFRRTTMFLLIVTSSSALLTTSASVASGASGRHQLRQRVAATPAQWSGFLTKSVNMERRSGGWSRVTAISFTFRVGAPGGRRTIPTSDEDWVQPFEWEARETDIETQPNALGTCVLTAKGEGSSRGPLGGRGSSLAAMIHAVPEHGILIAGAGSAGSQDFVLYTTDTKVAGEGCPDPAPPDRSVTLKLMDAALSVVNSGCGGEAGVCTWRDGRRTVRGGYSRTFEIGPTERAVYRSSLALTRLPDCDRDGIPNVRDERCTVQPPPPGEGTRCKAATWKFKSGLWNVGVPGVTYPSLARLTTAGISKARLFTFEPSVTYCWDGKKAWFRKWTMFTDQPRSFVQGALENLVGVTFHDDGFRARPGRAGDPAEVRFYPQAHACFNLRELVKKFVPGLTSLAWKALSVEKRRAIVLTIAKSFRNVLGRQLRRFEWDLLDAIDAAIEVNVDNALTNRTTWQRLVIGGAIEAF